MDRSTILHPCELGHLTTTASEKELKLSIPDNPQKNGSLKQEEAFK